MATIRTPDGFEIEVSDDNVVVLLARLQGGAVPTHIPIAPTAERPLPIEMVTNKVSTREREDLIRSRCEKWGWTPTKHLFEAASHKEYQKRKSSKYNAIHGQNLNATFPRVDYRGNNSFGTLNTLTETALVDCVDVGLYLLGRDSKINCPERIEVWSKRLINFVGEKLSSWGFIEPDKKLGKGLRKKKSFGRLASRTSPFKYISCDGDKFRLRYTAFASTKVRPCLFNLYFPKDRLPQVFKAREILWNELHLPQRFEENYRSTMCGELSLEEQRMVLGAVEQGREILFDKCSVLV